jgi:macrodomain Ter protein organizer (MatP/YcbG family)
MKNSNNTANYLLLLYSDGNSITDYKEFDNANHFVLGQSQWEEKAAYILNWIKTL